MPGRKIPSRLIGLLLVSALVLVIAVVPTTTISHQLLPPAKSSQISPETAELESVTGPAESLPANSVPAPPENEGQRVEGVEPGSVVDTAAEDRTAALTSPEAGDHSWQLAGQTRLGDTTEIPFDTAAVIEQSRNVFQVDAAGRPFIQQPSHEATIHAGQLQFMALVGDDGSFFNVNTSQRMTDTAVSATPLFLNIELAQITVGGRTIPMDNPPVYESDGNIAHAERAPYLLEEFVARDAGIEQQWRLEKPLETPGELVLTILAETPLTLTQTGEDIVFQVTGGNGEQIPAIQYSRAVAIDADGNRQWAQVAYEPLAMGTETNQYQLHFTFSKEWLTAAAYPILIDPLISNLIRLEQTAPANNQNAPEVTYNPDQDEFLLVWQDYRNGHWDIFGQRVSGGGALLDENFIITNAAYQQSNPRIAYGNGVYLVAWRHHLSSSATAYDVYGGIISGTGEIVSNNLPIAVNSSRREQPTDVVFNNSSGQFLVLWQEQGTYWDIWGRHVATDGSLSSAVQIAAQASWHKENAVATYNATDNQYLVVWRRHNGGSTHLVEGRRLNGNGSLLGSIIDISSGTGQERDPDVIYLPSVGRYVVAWSDNRNNSTNSYDIYGQRILPTGTLNGSNFIVAHAAVEESLPRLAEDAATGGALVVWQQNTGGGAGYDLYAHRIDSDGLLTGSSFVVEAVNANQNRPVLVQNSNGAYLIAWYDERNGNQDIFSRLRLADGNWGMAGMTHPAPGDQEKLQIAYNPDDDEYLVVWQDYRNGVNWDIYGQRVDGDGALLGANIAILPSTGSEDALHRTNPQVVYGANKYLLVWQHYSSSNTTYDVYGRLLNRGGSFATSAFAIASALDSSGKAMKESPNDVVFNSSSNQFLVLWKAEYSSNDWDILGRHVAATGSTGSYIQISALSGYVEIDAAGAYNPDNSQYLVVWDSTNQIGIHTVYGRRLTGSGTVTTTDTIQISTSQAPLAMADTLYQMDSDRYIVVWQQGGDIYSRGVLPTGSLAGGATAVANTSQYETYPRLAAHDEGLLAIWQRQNSSGYDLYGRLLSSTGQSTDGPVVVLEAEDNQQNGAIAYGGNERFLIAWQDKREGGWDLYAALFTPLRSWQLVSTISLSPTVSGEYAMAFDEDRNVAVLFGGNQTGWPYESTTWEFNGVDWDQITTAQKPEAVYGAAIAYDSGQDEMVLFGGSNAADEALAQTWIYDGSNWVLQTPTNSPLARTEHRLVYDPGTQKIYLFGGRNGETYYNDVWRYDGNNWTQITVSGQSPSARSFHALAFYPPTNTFLLFGGRNASGEFLSDTWAFNPVTNSWTQLSTGPLARQGHSLVYDPIQLRLVLVGGVTNGGDTILDDTWSYQESAWSNTNAIPAAPAGIHHTLIYDSSDDALILFTNGETWRFK